jgi:dihydrofolate reductase
MCDRSAQIIKPQKIIIAALAENGVIGDHDRLPWWVPEEYSQFLKFITDQTVIWGRKTFEIFGSRPPSRRNIVVSHRKEILSDAMVVTSVDEALQKAEEFPEDIFIAGGATIYRQTLKRADKMYLSFIKGKFSGDAFFPRINPNEWVVEQRRHFADYEFVIYAAKKKQS